MAHLNVNWGPGWIPTWGSLDLAKQFVLASFLVIGLGMLGFGHWVNLQIRQGVIQHTASTTALYMESFVEPLVQGLEGQKQFNVETNKAFDNLLSGPLKHKLIALKIWNLDASIAYSNFPELIGQKFEIDNSLAGAFRGELTAELGHTEAAENLQERKMNIPLLEVYSPLYDLKTKKIIGVGEFYLNSDELLKDLKRQTILTWSLIAAFTLAMVGVLSAIMLYASDTIEQQKLQLKEQVTDLSTLLSKNVQLNRTIRIANKKAVTINDQLLNRLAADLHDGPAQLLAFALLRLSDIKTHETNTAGNQTGKLRQAIADALNEIRLISSGLNLPQLEHCSLENVVKLAIGNHEKMTRTKVHLKTDGSEPKVSTEFKACLYRIAQEGLTNSFKHGEGINQSVVLKQAADIVVLEVRDQGKGFNRVPNKGNTNHLGLAGLQNRVSVFGGTVTLVSALNEGVALTANIPVAGDIGH